MQARLCFRVASVCVSDELKRRHQLTTCSFVDFLEIMGRLTTFMRMPEPEVLEKYECKTAKEFYDQIATGVHEGSVMVKTTEGPGQRQKSLDDLVHAFHWYDEEVLLESIDDSLEMLVSLILDRLDESGDGKIERADLVQRRTAAAQIAGAHQETRFKLQRAIEAEFELHEEVESSINVLHCRRVHYQVHVIWRRLSTPSRMLYI